MGKASRRKRELNKMSPSSKKVLKEMIKESSPDIFVIENKDGSTKAIYFNPLKKLLKGEKYISEDGRASTAEMVKQYEQFLKTRANIESMAKKTGIDPDNVITEE